MQIAIITGSGHKNSASSSLAEAFCHGASKEGCKIIVFNAAYEMISPCIACNSCRKNNKCIYNDSFDKFAPELIKSDVVVWATPVYYMTMSAQLKTAIDRMYQLEEQPQFKGSKKYILLATAWYNNINVFDNLVETFDSFCRYLKWEKKGEILAYGVNSKFDLENSPYLEQAYLLGQSLF